MTDSISSSQRDVIPLLSNFQVSQLMKWLGISIRLLLASLLISIAVAQVLVAICALLWLALMWKGLKYRPTILDVPLLIYITCRLLSVIFSTHFSLSIVAINRELIFYVSYFFMAFYLGYANEDNVSSLLRWLFYPTALVTLFAVGQYLFSSVDRARALTGGGTISLHLCLTLLALLIYKDHNKIFNSLIHWWGILIIFIAGIVFSLTRGEWIAAAVISLIYGGLFDKKLLFGIVLIGIIAGGSIPSVSQRLLTLGSPLENSSDRIALWENAFSHSTEHPVLGFGPETFPVVFDGRQNIVDKGVDSWHNDFIHQYMESGILGVMSYLGILCSFLFASLNLVRSGIAYITRIGWMGIILLIAYLISGFFSIPTFSITNALLFRFMLAIVAVEYYRYTLLPRSE